MQREVNREDTREGCCPRCRILKSSGVLGLSLLKYIFRDVSKCRFWLHLQVKQILDCLTVKIKVYSSSKGRYLCSCCAA